jgi:ATP-dependent RNA/DNA helicase IGHMBP2
VDNILERLDQHKSTVGKVVRIGHPARLLESVQKYSLDALVERSDSSEVTQQIRRDINKLQL